MLKSILCVDSFFLLSIFFLLQGCVVSEQRIREIVSEEISTAMKRTTILGAKTVGPYSPALQAGNFLFISGQIALDPETGILQSDDIETETRTTLDNLNRILHQAGYDSSDIVSTFVFLKDIADYSKMNNIYGGYFQEGNYPTRSTVQVAGLPRGARVEISAIAFKSK